MHRVLEFLVVASLVAGCGRKPDTVVIDPEHPWRQPGDKIDSMLPMDEYVRRFRIGEVAPATLGGGAPDRETLAREYLAAVAVKDSGALMRLLVTKAEFAWLIFPDHLYAREPYALDPDIFWLRTTQETRKGSTRVLNRYGGRPLAFRALSGCVRDTLQILSGPDTLWNDCAITYQAGDSTLTRRLFGTIVQRDGQFKFLSYHTEF